MTDIVYDCDPGNDDAVAILAAFGHPALSVLAVTTGAGHLAAERTARNAAVAVAMAGRDLAVSAGAEAPLLRERVIARFLDMSAGLDPERFDLPAAPLDPRHAALRIADEAQTRPGLTVVCTGPLTNLALALRLRPGIAARIGRIVALGGAWGLGTRTAAAEWNVFCDPEAAAVVYGAGVPITMIPVDASRTVPVDAALTGALEAAGGRAAGFAAELLHSLRRSYRPGLFDLPETPLHDPCAILYAGDPGLGRTVPARVEIETRSGVTYGRTTIDFAPSPERPANAEVLVEFAVAATLAALTESLARLP